MSLLLGCIADDHTGATDLGAMLSRAGMAVQLIFGLPDSPIETIGYDAVIIALKSRSIHAEKAIEQSLTALAVLRDIGAEQLFFKYCSTFDSTDAGNIGPVAEALADELDAERVLFCPAFPENGRTVYNGYLFVHGKPLNESGMENHPLNPMGDANLVRVLDRQSQESVGLLPYPTIEAGVEATKAGLASLLAESKRLVIVDSLQDTHLQIAASAAAEDRLLTGGSAFARSVANVLLARGAGHAGQTASFAPPAGHSVVIAGSCSPATRRQVANFKAIAPAIQIDPLRLVEGELSVEKLVRQAADHLKVGPVMIYSTANPAAVEAAHHKLGRAEASGLIEESLASIASGLVERGVRRLVVAGGETSGAVTRALKIQAVEIGPEIAPGVPWVQTLGNPCLALALKSGNFGSDYFFQDALRRLP